MASLSSDNDRPTALFGSSAPFVVTLLVSVASWVLTTYYTEMSEVVFLHQSTNVEEDADARILTYNFQNRSAKVHLIGATMSIVCPDMRERCFVPIDDDGRLAEMLRVPPWAITDDPLASRAEITQELNLPVGMAFALRFSVPQGTEDPLVMLATQAGLDYQVRLIDGYSLEVFLVRNFLWVLLLAWILTAALLLILYFFARRRSSVSAPSEQIVHVKLL